MRHDHVKAKKRKIKQNVLISISIDAKLIKQIDELAAKENRTRSNFISSKLIELLD